MSLRDALNKNDFVFKFSGLNRLAEPAKSSVIMEKTVALPTTEAATSKVGGVNINAETKTVATAEKEVKALETKPKKAMGRKAAVEARTDEARPKAKKRAVKPETTQITIRDLSAKAPKAPRKSKKEAAQESVKEILGSD